MFAGNPLARYLPKQAVKSAFSIFLALVKSAPPILAPVKLTSFKSALSKTINDK